MSALDLSFELAQIRGTKLDELRELETRAEQHLEEVRAEAGAADVTLKQIRRIIAVLDPPPPEPARKSITKTASIAVETLERIYDRMLTDDREWDVADLAAAVQLSDGAVRNGIRHLRDQGRVRLTGQSNDKHPRNLYRAIPTLPERPGLPAMSHVS